MGTPLVIFVAMPGTDMGPHATWRNAAEIKQYLYEPVADQVEAALERKVDLRIEKDKIGQGVIHRSMFNEALQAPVYIVDLTGANANVYLELGVRWALRDRVTVLVCQNEERDIKFNVSPSRVIRYGPEPPELKSACEKIVRAILEGLADGSDGAADSLVRQHLDKKELHLVTDGMYPEPTGRHAPGGRLLDLCLGHFGPPGGDPAHPAEQIRHQQCLPEDRTEWLIKRLPPVGARKCPDRLNVGIKNHETKLYVNHGDRNRPLMGNEEKLISLVPAGQSAHGCTVQVIGPSESCMAAPAPAEGSADSEVAWMPCNKGRSDQRWLIEFSNKSDGRNWLLFHPIDDTSRCLRQSENNVKTAPLCQGGWLAQWTVE